jgi:HK97 family phage major capsid protein
VIAIGDVHAWYFDLPAQFRGNARWSTTSSFMADIAGLQINANKGDLSESPDSAMVGKPVLQFDGTGWDDATALAASEELGVIGDFSNYYLVDRVGMSLTRDDSIDVKTDQVWFGARVRGDGRVGLADAFRIMKLPA